MVQKNYIGVNGLVTQSIDEIRTDLIAQFKSIYGEDINIEQNSPDGQWINILAQEKKDTLDLITQIYNNLDVDRAIGIPQQILYKLNGLTIKAYTYSYCYVNVTTTEAVTLQGLDDNLENADGVGYTVNDVNGNRWILTETQTISQTGTYLLNFRAAELGNITSLPNTITVMETILKGVSNVNNPAGNYITGDTGESSSEFRTRRNQTMAVPSQGFDESIQSQLLNLDNVTQAKVYDNRTSSTKDGIPAHTVWVIVEGGESAEIGRIIYNNIPPGIAMKGNQSVSVPKISGDLAVVKYDLPNPIDIYIKANIKNTSTSPLDENYIKQQLALNTFSIGEAAESANITAFIKNIIGEQGNPYDVQISLNNTSYSTYLTPTGLSDYFVINPSKIQFVVA